MKKSKGIILFLALILLLCSLFAVTLTVSAEEESFVPKMSITMSESLTFNIYVPQDERLAALSLDGESMDINALPEKDGYYHIALPLAACDADREVKLSVTFESSEEKKVGTFTFSVVKYVEKLLSGDESDTVKKLAKDILAYIESAKAFFNKGSSTDIADLLSGYETVFSPVTAENSTECLNSATFVLGATPSVRFYLASGYSSGDFSFTQGENSLNYTVGSDSDGEYVEIKTYAYAMIDTFSYTVKNVEGSSKYNLSAYCYWAENVYEGEDKEALVDLSEKFYVYCESAAAYRREVIISTCEHSYSSTVKNKATATNEGIMEYSCSKCGHRYEEAIPTTLKVLAVGNSFSVDAMQHLYLVAKDAGIENVVLGNLYIGGCSLSTHLTKMNNDAADYTFYVSDDSSGGMVKEGTRTAKYGITYTDWDYITVQQASNYSGLPERFTDLQDVLDYVNANKTSDATILWHMTWAYQQDSTHSGFASYNNDQMTMYNAIVGVVNDKILTNDDIKGFIPSGTAIQNLRTSELGDTLTRDGFHLSYGIGRYTAALTWLAYLTGCDIDKITATPSEYPEVAIYLDHIKDAVKKAIAKPLEVTESAYPAPDKLINTTLSPLTEDDISYLNGKGYTASDYMVLDLDVIYNAYYNSTSSTKYATYAVAGTSDSQYMKWWTTQIFSRSELITGSIIRLDAGYKYRPEGWIDMAKNSSRPGVVTPTDTSGYCITVDDAWWGDYNYRAFNVGKYDGSSYTRAEYDAYANAPDTLNFKVYIPIVKRAELTEEDIEYLQSKGLNPDEYKVLDFTYTLDAHYNSSTTNISNVIESTGNVKYKYVATQIMSKYDLTPGSLIRITDSTHKYRPEGWVTLSTQNSSSQRPGQVTQTLVTVDASWWGIFDYRGFNIYDPNASSEDPVNDEDASAIRIYIKIA